MIDFKNASLLKLHRSSGAFDKKLAPMLISDEEIIETFVSVRDGVVFTNKRIFVVNIQGLTGKKRDITSLPYAKIQAFSIESSGVMDIDSELVLWFSGLGSIRLEFMGGVDMYGICKIISEYTL